MNNPGIFYEEVARDEGLRSKGRILTVFSLVLILVEMSGATIREANTFIFRISFEHEHGIPAFLVLSVCFLIIRYHNYASIYHKRLYTTWSDKLLHDPVIHNICDHSDEVSGLIHEKSPGIFRPEANGTDDTQIQFGYKCVSPFKRVFELSRIDQHGSEERASINIRRELGGMALLTVLLLEVRYQYEGYLVRRENLTIIGPYLIGILSILSFFSSKHLEALINLLA